MSILVEETEPVHDVDDPPFEPRDVVIKCEKWVTDEYEIGDFLGRGKFGEVKRCLEKSTGNSFAAKFICAERPQDKKEVEREIQLMQKLQHKRILQLYDAFACKGEMCLVLEIILGGELFDRVIDDDFVLTERACVIFMRQICEGVAYMHSRNIVHLDMKPENILCLTKTGNRIKIIDFGLAQEYDPKKDLKVLFGTPEFMAPEVVQFERIDFSTDMWSIGVICYVLLSGLSPFMGDNDGETLSNVIIAEYDYDYDEFQDVSTQAKDFITKLLVKDTKGRMTADESLRHPWLKRHEKQETPDQSLDLSKKRLKRFVNRRKWQKIVNAITALKRMGVELKSLRRRSVVGSAQMHTVFGYGEASGAPAGSEDSDGRPDGQATSEIGQVQNEIGLTRGKLNEVTSKPERDKKEIQDTGGNQDGKLTSKIPQEEKSIQENTHNETSRKNVQDSSMDTSVIDSSIKTNNQSPSANMISGRNDASSINFDVTTNVEEATLQCVCEPILTEINGQIKEPEAQPCYSIMQTDIPMECLSLSVETKPSTEL